MTWAVGSSSCCEFWTKACYPQTCEPSISQEGKRCIDSTLSWSPRAFELQSNDPLPTPMTGKRWQRPEHTDSPSKRGRRVEQSRRAPSSSRTTTLDRCWVDLGLEQVAAFGTCAVGGQQERGVAQRGGLPDFSSSVSKSQATSAAHRLRRPRVTGKLEADLRCHTCVLHGLDGYWPSLCLSRTLRSAHARCRLLQETGNWDEDEREIKHFPSGGLADSRCGAHCVCRCQTRCECPSEDPLMGDIVHVPQGQGSCL